MDQLNAIITCRATRLGLDAETIEARVGHSSRIGLKCVPDDITRIVLRVFRMDGSYHDIPANRHPNGNCTVYVIGTCFPAVGTARYEVHALDARGNPTAIAAGKLVIAPFSVSTEPVSPGSEITVAQIPTADGAMVQIRMVQDESGQWVYQAVTGE